MRKLVAPAIGAIAIFALLAPTVEAKSKWADIRVVTSDGTTLADHRQSTSKVKVDTLEGPDCFGSPSSGESYRFGTPNVLGTLVDASKSDGDLQPITVTDAFQDTFGLGVCDIGGIETVGFSYWYSAINGVGATTAPDQIDVGNGDRHTWYLTTGEEAGLPNELAVKAPTRVGVQESFRVTVTRIKADGTKRPARGVDVTTAAEPTDRDGETEIVLPEGTFELVATGKVDDIPSARVAVCASDQASSCPRYRGRDIFGSRSDDTIKATKGPDTIDCGLGHDVVKDPGGDADEFIAESCEKVKTS